MRDREEYLHHFTYSMRGSVSHLKVFLRMNIQQTLNTIIPSLPDYISTAATASEIPPHKRVHTLLSTSTDLHDYFSPLLHSPT